MTKIRLIVLFLFAVFSFSLEAFSESEVIPLGPNEFLNGPSEKQRMRDSTVKIKEAIEISPTDYTNYEMLAIAYDYFGRYEDVIEALNKAISFYPKHQRGIDALYGNLARTYINLGKIDEAKPIIDKSIKLNPENIYNRKHLLNYYLLKEQYQDLAVELEKMSTFDETADFYHDLYAFLFERKTDQKEIIKIFKVIVNTTPKSHLAHKGLASALRGYTRESITKNFKVAIKEYKKALALKPDYIQTYIAIADTYMLKALTEKDDKYFKDTIKWFDKAEKIDPTHLKLIYAESHFYLYVKRFDEAIEKLHASFAEGNNSPEFMRLLADAYNAKAYFLYEEGEQLEDGLELINKALSLFPDDAILLSTKAEILYKLRRYKTAHFYIKKALVLAPGNEEMQQDLAKIEKALGQEDGE